MFSINPKRIIDYIGQILTPALLGVLAILFVKAFLTFTYTDAPVSVKYQQEPFLKGFLEGYFTMDAVAALAFGIVIINGLKDKGVTQKKQQIQGSIYAGIIAACGLVIVYLSLGWIGRVLPHDKPFENGAEILVLSSQQLFGYGGNMLFGVIVVLACLTTCVGLITACARFFNEIFSNYSYEKFVSIFIVIGLIFTNFGLDMILQVAAPLLVFIYPLSIVLIILSLFQHFVGYSKKMYIFSISVATFLAVYEMLATLNIRMDVLDSYFALLPLSENGLGWTVPTLLAAVIGYALDYKR